MGSRGIFFLVAGPTAAGKTTVLWKFLKASPGLVKDVSVTTRPPRRHEANGRDYHFWDRKRFERAVRKGQFLEHAVVHGVHLYGTLRSQVEKRLLRGIDVVKDIDVQGVAQIRRAMPYPDSVGIFLAPPGPKDLLARFRKRGTEDEKAMARRLRSAQKEVRKIAEYEYLVLNRNVEEAVRDLSSIRRAEKCKRERSERDFQKTWQLKG